MSDVAEEFAGGLLHRAQRMQLAMADVIAQKQQQHGAENADNALRRTLAASTALRSLDAVETEARAAGLEPDELRRRDRDAASRARTALRTTATKLRDPNNDVGGLVTTRTLVEAIEAAESIVSRRSAALESAFVAYVRDHRPSGLSDVVTDGLEPFSLAAKVARLQHALSIDGGVQVQNVVEKFKEFGALLAEWENLQPELVEAQKRMAPGLRDFLREARAGVPWHLITPEIRSWLDEEGNADAFLVVRRGAF